MILFHVGYSKCMSTWLQHFFSSNSNISITINSIDKFEIPSVKQRFARCREAGQICVESDEHYLMSEVDSDILVNCANESSVIKFLDFVMSLGEQFKILVVVRPVDKMLISRYAQFIRSGGKFSFEEFYNRLFLHGNYLQYFDYDVSRLVNLLGELGLQDRIMVINQDVFKQNRESVLSALQDFYPGVSNCGVDTFPESYNTSVRAWAFKPMCFLNRLMVLRKRSDLGRTICRGGFFGFLVWEFSRRVLEFFGKRFGKTLRLKSVMSNDDYIYFTKHRVDFFSDPSRKYYVNGEFY